MDELPRMFIGCSSESLNWAEHLQAALETTCDATVWNQGIFEAGGTTLGSLRAALKDNDFGTFIFAPDDKIKSRGEERDQARDNTLLECGLFLGALGVDRTYIIVSDPSGFKIPSDLFGTNYLPIRRRADGNIRASISPAALQIRERVAMLGKIEKDCKSENLRSSSDNNAKSALFLQYASDSMQMLTRILHENGSSIMHHSLLQWANNTVGMVADIFSERAPDIEVNWLRPDHLNQNRLVLYASTLGDKAEKHYEFRKGEGLAGLVWQKNEPAATTRMRQHPWWVFRIGCENMTYMCAPVGLPDETGGVLSVGSNTGFELDDNEDLSRLMIFANILSFSVNKDRWSKK